MKRVVIGRCLLQSILDDKHMTQSELAALTGYTKQEINDWVHLRRTMSIRTAKTIVKALKISCIDELYEWLE